MMGKDYPHIYTGFSEITKGVFRNDAPPCSSNDVLLEAQAIAIEEEVNGIIHGKILIVKHGEELGDGPFNFKLYMETRNPPYKTIGYRRVRTLKNMVLGEMVEDMKSFRHFTAELDTDWEEINFLFDSLS